jgi:hypothetical protein
MLQPPLPDKADLDTAIAETALLIEELDLRIARQQKRVERIKVTGHGEVEESQAIFTEMTKARELMKAQIADLETERAKTKSPSSSGT